MTKLSTLAIMIATTVAGIGHAAAAEKTLRIGVLGPLSGSAAAYGAELVRGAEMRAEEINKAGGLKVGPDVYRMEVVAYDHKANAAEAATATNKLVYQDKIQYIVGNAIGATCNAAQTITEPQKVLFGFVCWGTKNLGPDKPYSFRTIHSQWEVVAPFYDWIKKPIRILRSWRCWRRTIQAVRTPSQRWSRRPRRAGSMWSRPIPSSAAPRTFIPS
jgi:branched-chain amino acid transport system substrate-binding protein